MKTFVLILAVLATSAYAENVDIDWSTVKSIEEYPEFWKDKPFQPPASFFERVSTNRIGRIVGGQVATPHQFPYQVAVLMFLPSIGGNALCGGSLLGTRFIITAAHCVQGATSGTIVLGAHDLTNANEANQVRMPITPNLIRMHENWDPSVIRNDIALVRLPSAVTHNAFISSITLPLVGEINELFNGQQAVVSGWGRFSDAENRASDVLKFVEGPVMTNLACSIRFPTVIQPSNICLSGAGGGGACSGDSGGPLTVQRRGSSMQIGVVSFGLALGCELGWPSVFARTTFFHNWLQLNTQESAWQ